MAFYVIYAHNVIYVNAYYIFYSDRTSMRFENKQIGVPQVGFKARESKTQRRKKKHALFIVCVILAASLTCGSLTNDENRNRQLSGCQKYLNRDEGAKRWDPGVQKIGRKIVYND